MPLDLTGKTIVITGASAGIGAATAIECARAGMDVVLNARRADRLDEVAGQVRKLGRRAECVAGDVTEPGNTSRMLDAAGAFHAVFANAGYGFRRHVTETSDAELRRIFDVNFFASVDLVREAARRLIERRRPGHLLMCSSSAAKFAVPSLSAYTATKAAQNHFCRAMRLELEPHGIDVTSVHPTRTDTEFFEVADRITGDGSKTPRRRGLHSAERVARAVVSCLRRPRSEVWTSLPIRTLAGLWTLTPGLIDALIRRAARSRGVIEDARRSH